MGMSAFRKLVKKLGIMRAIGQPLRVSRRSFAQGETIGNASVWTNFSIRPIPIKVEDVIEQGWTCKVCVVLSC